MFKAISRWGSQVRSSVNLQIFSNIFGSKSKKYDDLGNEDEEVFIDAQEDIDHESDTEEDKITSVKFDSVKNENSGSNGDNSVAEHVNGDLKAVETGHTRNEQIITQADVTVTEVREDASTALTDSNNDSSSLQETKAKNSDSEGDENDSEEEHEDDDDHHINHKDTKQMVKNSKQSNGLVHSASAAMIQKVHRRMNSYSQRQYSKFDNAQDDENENVIHSAGECSQDDVDSPVTDDQIEQAHVIKNKKKTKRKKKIAKRTGKAVRGTWKWFKRSMVAYAHVFNFSPTFIGNIASTRGK